MALCSAKIPHVRKLEGTARWVMCVQSLLRHSKTNMDRISGKHKSFDVIWFSGFYNEGMTGWLPHVRRRFPRCPENWKCGRVSGGLLQWKLSCRTDMGSWCYWTAVKFGTEERMFPGNISSRVLVICVHLSPHCPPRFRVALLAFSALLREFERLIGNY